MEANIRVITKLVKILLAELVANAMWHNPKKQPTAPDPGDGYLWALLNYSDNCQLVTGDTLLIERPPKNGTVISARKFAEVRLGLSIEAGK